jgi:voltage-gated potassium channel
MIYRKLAGILIALTIVFTTGVTGYQLIEGWNTLDAFYMTVITLATVGFLEVHPLSDTGRMFTAFLILCGSGLLVYGISIVTAFVVEGELTDALRRRKMEKKIAGLRGHYIVCGAGETGKYIIEELEKTKRDFVTVEKDTEKIKRFIERGILCVEGDATHDDVLIRAGIKNAKGIITSLHSDAENLFVVFTARRLNPGLRVISKALEEESEQKIRMAGADGVVMPNYIGGLRMVSEMIRPSVVTFLDTMLRLKEKTIRVEEIEIGKVLAGEKLDETGILNIEGVTVVALKDRTGSYMFNPSGNKILEEDTVIIAMGNVDKIEEIKRLRSH